MKSTTEACFDNQRGRAAFWPASGLMLALAVLCAGQAQAASTLFWSNNGTTQGGAGTWDTSSLNWGSAAAGPFSSVWNNANNDVAVFGSTAGTVTLGTGITVGGMTYNTTAYTVATGANTLTFSTGAVIKSAGNMTETFSGTLAAVDNTFHFLNTTTTNNFANSNLFTISYALSGANNVDIQNNGGASAAPVYLGSVATNTLSYTGTTTVAANAALGFDLAVVSIPGASISMGSNSTIMCRGGNLSNTLLGKISATTNSFTIVGNNAGTASALNLSNFPNASLALWDNAGTVSFGFTGVITPGSNGYLFGSSRVGNAINIGGTNGTGAVTNNILTGTAGLTFVAGSIGANNLNLWGSNSFSGNTINNVASRAISINNPLALQNSPIDTSGVGTYVLGTGSSGSGGSGAVANSAPTIGGLIGSKNLLSSVIVAAGYNLMTSLKLNPGADKSLSYSGIIANSTAGLSLVKNGAGTQTLSGTNTYLGMTTLNAGTLFINGDQSMATGLVVVNTGGTLGGMGTIGGLTLVQSGGIYSPGNTAPGTLKHAAGLNVAAGGIYNWKNVVANATGVGGTDFDVANIIGGTLSLDATSSTGSRLKLNFAQGTDFANAFWGTNQSWEIVTGGVAGSNLFDAGNITIFINGVQLGTDNTVNGRGGFSTVVAAGSLQLQWTAGATSSPNAFWTGATGGAGNWESLTNWFTAASGGSQVALLPDISTAVHFSTSSPTPVNLTADLSVNRVVRSLSFDAASPSISVASANGSSLTITPTVPSSGITVASTAGDNTLNAKIVLGANQTWTTDQALLVSSEISGAFSLTKSGASVLTLSGTNTFTGSTTIGNGTLQIGNGGASGSIDTSLGVINNGSLYYNRNNAATIAYPISGTGMLNQLGAGVLTLLGTNTYSGPTTVSAGTLQVGNGGTIGSIDSTSGVTNNAALVFNRSDAINIGFTISGSGTVTQSGTGSLTLTSSNPYTGATNVSAGTLVVNGALTASATTLSTGGALRGSGSVQSVTTNGGLIWPGSALKAPNLVANETLAASSVNLSGGKLSVICRHSNASNQKLTTGTLTIDANSILSLAYEGGQYSDTFTVIKGGFAGPVKAFSKVLPASGYNVEYKLVYKASGVTVTGGDGPVLGATLPAYDQVDVVFLNLSVAPVKLADFRAEPSGAGVRVSWTAVSEYKNVGFHIYRRNADHEEWVRVNPALIIGRMTNPDELNYMFYDWAPAGQWIYKLESIDVRGGRETYEQLAGPVAVDWIAGTQCASVDSSSISVMTDCLAAAAGVSYAERVARQFAANGFIGTIAARDLSEDAKAADTLGRSATGTRELAAVAREIARLNAGVGARWFSSSLPASPTSFIAAKVLYNKPGIALIPQAALPAGFNVNRVAIQREGRTVTALAQVPGGLLVYAPGYQDDYTDKDAFFLRQTSTETAAGTFQTATGLFSSTLPVKVTSSATASAQFHDIYFDYGYRPYNFAPWFSKQYLTSGTTQSFSLDTPGASGGAATLTINLWSLTDELSASPDHALQIVINGTPVGAVQWDGGNKAMELAVNVPGGILRPGGNTIDLVTPSLEGVLSQVAFLHSLSIDYSRTLDGSKTIEISNASTTAQLFELQRVADPMTWVVDARFPDRAVLVPIETQQEQDGTYRLRFIANAGGSGKYLVVPKGEEIQPLTVSARQVKALNLKGTYLATGPTQFAAGVQPLLAKRGKEGIRGAFVDQEQLFDFYNYGRYGPGAIQKAIRATRPQYLLLLGRTTYDYRNYTGANVDPSCPAFLVSTSFWAQTTSDAMFGDLGRGFPEVAVGRLPVNDAADLSVAVGRIIRHQGVPMSGMRGQLVGDAIDPEVADFGAQLDALAGNHAEVTWEKNMLGLTHATANDVNAAMTGAANGGADVIVYNGHGNSARLGKSAPQILDTTTVQNWKGNVVVVQSTCAGNWMANNQTGWKSIAIQALTQPQGGISASIGTSTYMNPDVAMAFIDRLIGNTSVSGVRWGQALLNSQQWALSPGANGFKKDLGWTEQLFGDPAMPVSVPVPKSDSGNTAGVPGVF